MKSDAETVEDYLATLPDDRAEAITTVRDTIRANLPDGIVETMNWGMISYEVPLELCPDTYNGKPLQLAALASQKKHMAVYLTSVYSSPATYEWFVSEYEQRGKKSDIGKSCVRFTKLENLPLDLVGQVIADVDLDEFLRRYEESRS